MKSGVRKGVVTTFSLLSVVSLFAQHGETSGPNISFNLSTILEVKRRKDSRKSRKKKENEKENEYSRQPSLIIPISFS